MHVLSPLLPSLSFTSIAGPGLWIGFLFFVLILLVLDLFVFRRDAHEIRFREALGWSIFWIVLAMAFNVGIYFYFGPEKGPRLAAEFFQGYLLEKALSVDNLFVFLIIFSYFNVPAKFQRRVLFWGILGALVMRAVFILAGAALLQLFHPILYVFAAFLIFTGIKMLLSGDQEANPGKSLVVRLFRRYVPSVPEYHEDRFFIVRNGRRLATPLLFVLATVEFTDVVFALDSIPAVFGVTQEPFIVYTSNIFAILGLRALFFLLAGMMGKFHYLKIGLAIVLIFIGVKMSLKEMGLYDLPTSASLCVIAGLIVLSITASLLWPVVEPLPHPPGVKADSVDSTPASENSKPPAV